MANELCDKMIAFCNQQVNYFNSLPDAEKAVGTRTYSQTDFCRTALGYLAQSAMTQNMNPLSEKLQKALADVSNRLPGAQQFAPPQPQPAQQQPQQNQGQTQPPQARPQAQPQPSPQPKQQAQPQPKPQAPKQPDGGQL